MSEAWHQPRWAACGKAKGGLALGRIRCGVGGEGDGAMESGEAQTAWLWILDLWALCFALEDGRVLQKSTLSAVWSSCQSLFFF